MEKARVKFTSGITGVTGLSGFLLEVTWMIKWRMPLKCDFTTGPSHAQTPACADKTLFFHKVATAVTEHRRRRTARTAESAVHVGSHSTPR